MATVNVKDMSNEELQAHIKKLASVFEAESKNLSNLELDEKNRMPDIVSGGLRDMNKIIWPNTFSSNYLELSPSKQYAERNISITAEAAFVATKMVKSVFKRNGVGQFVWVNPEDISVVVNDIYLQTSDPQSGRNFNQQPMNIQDVGYAKFPTQMLSRPLILPNSSINVKLYAQNQVDTYFCNISFIGYRVRIEDAQDLLGLVTRY